MISERLDALVAAFERGGSMVSPNLNPALSERAFREAVKWFPSPIPADLAAMYQWRNGCRDDDSTNVLLFRDTAFVSAQEAGEHYRTIVERYADDESNFDVRACFPFAHFDSAWLVLCCGEQTMTREHKHPVVSIFEGNELFFCSLDAMVETCVAWVSSPDRRDNMLPDTTERRIWLEHNPGVFDRRR